MPNIDINTPNTVSAAYAALHAIVIMQVLITFEHSAESVLTMFVVPWFCWLILFGQKHFQSTNTGIQV